MSGSRSTTSKAAIALAIAMGVASGAWAQSPAGPAPASAASASPGAAPPSDVPPSPGSTPAPASTPPTGQLTRAPELAEFVEAEYPAQALADGRVGDVVLRVTIDAAGAVTDVQVEQPAGHGFDESARAAVQRFRFRPAEVDGVPAAVQILYRYAFTLEQQAEEVAVTPDTERPTGLLRGELREKGTRAPLSGVVVRIPELGVEAVTDAEGRFELGALPAGTVTLVIDDPAYYAVEDRETVVAGQATEVRFRMERQGGAGDEIVVVGRRVQKEVARRVLTVEEIRKIPGTSGDALKVVQNLPGVARIPFGGGMLIIRGSNPGDSGAVIERHFVPLAFHFGGLRSVFASALIESVDFYPGNFGAELGRFSGGIVDVRVRRPKTDRIHGYAEADVFDAGFLVEGPVGEDGAFAVAARRSYIDAILPAVLPADAELDFVTAPRYYDYQLIYDWQHGAHRVRAIGFGSDDVLKFLLEEPADIDPAFRGDFENQTRFYRLFLQWQARLGEDAANDLSLSVGRNEVFFSGTDRLSFQLGATVVTLREDLSLKMDEALTLRAGLDVESLFGEIDITAPLPPKEGDAGGATTPIGTRQSIRARRDFLLLNPALWTELQVKVTDHLLLVPGMRLDYDGRLEDVAVDPRLNARWEVLDGTTLKGGVGRYMQRPQPDESDPDFGNPEIRLEHSTHYTLGAEQRLADGVSVDAQGFYKQLDDLVTRADGVNTLNQGAGRIYGLEVLLRHELIDRFFGWISYTLMRSERKDAPGDPYRIFDLDQTHILTLIAHYKLSNAWEIGGRWRYVTGNPQTKLKSGTFVSDADTYAPYPGPTNAERLPAFHQLDVRVDRRWTFDDWIFTAYLEIQNVYNRQNPEGWQYDYRYQDRRVVPSLPIIPSFGLRGEL